MTRWRTVHLPGPEVGAMAQMIGNLGVDPRLVQVVSADGEHIWLELGVKGSVAGPYPASNYTYYRVEKEDD